jgi:putative drug exporter of the RND superfamily
MGTKLAIPTEPIPKGQAGARRRFRLAMAGCALALVLLPFSFRAERHLETTAQIEHGQAAQVDRELATRFQSPYANRLVLVFTGLPEPYESGRNQAIDFIEQSLRSEPGVSIVTSELDWSDPLFEGSGSGGLMLIGLDTHAANLESLLASLRARCNSLRAQLHAQYPTLTLQITGETPLNVDVRKISSQEVEQAEVRVVPITLILLLIAFGSLVAALLPVGVGLLAISMTMGAVALIAEHFHLSILVQNLASMLGLGLGIDYALLMVNRFRESLAEGLDPGAAADLLWKNAGHTLIISASTVTIGFTVLLTVPIGDIRSIGVAGLLVAAMSLLLCTMVLPWVLSLLGTRINRWSLGATVTGFLRRLVPGGGGSVDPRAPWRRLGMAVTARPWLSLLLAGAPLIVLALQGRHISLGLPSGDWFPPGAESVKAIHTLEKMGHAGIVQPIRIVVDLPPDTSPTSVRGWDALSRFTRFIASDRRCAEVLSVTTLVGDGSGPSNLDNLPEQTRKSFLSSDGRAALLEVMPTATVTASQEVFWVQQLRKVDIAEVTGLSGTKMRIGGYAAWNADYEEVADEYLPRVMAAVIAGSFIALLVGFRSVFVAVKAVLLNLLSVGASFGALVLVFQDGLGGGIFGIPGGVGKVFMEIPIVSFAIVFGLSMDYEVFLVARVREERRRGLGERAAVAEGLAGTGGLITSAAAIMISVFAAFTLGGFLAIKMMGFTLAVAVLIDATLVRMIIGPALLQLAGDWNWWPWGLAGSNAAHSSD